MTITVDGRDYAHHEISIINGRAHLVVSMGMTLAPIVNDVAYSEYEYRVVDGVATLSIPMGEALVAPLSEQFSSSSALATLDEMDKNLGLMIDMIEAHIPERAVAPIVDISLARTGGRRTSRPHNNAEARTGLTPRSIN